MSQTEAPLPRIGAAWTRPARRAVALAALATIVFLCRFSLARAAGEWLVIDDRPRPSEAVYVLMGDVHSRPARAAQLVESGIAPRILLSRVRDSPAAAVGVYPNDTDAAVGMLARLGVPESAVTVLPEPVTSTWEEAESVRAHADSVGIRRLLVVTTAVHGRRARWLFRKAFRGSSTELSFVTVEDWRFDARTWWRTEAGLLAVSNEYLKLMHNLLARR